mmetsp:Transcript_15906/g.62153  ORF Transcript_15906/g.62153 Transcript_15906/m.62153 type:complete len:213 (+) Transcript_15906:267-905(+)
MALLTSSLSAANSSGTGAPTRMPLSILNRLFIARTPAHSSGVSRRMWGGWPDSLTKKAGKSSTPKPTTVTPCVSSTSRVLPISRMLFTPALTTSMDVLPSSTRSALTSIVFSPSIWTPPMPPVTNTEIPALLARTIVADTVVAPYAPACASTGAMSRREAFTASRPALPNASRSSAERPIFTLWSIIATVAGTAPCARTTASTASAVSTFSG